MTPGEFEAIITGFWPIDPGNAQDREVAKFFRRDPRTIRRWRLGELPISAETAMLLRTMDKYGHPLAKILPLGDLPK